MTPRKTTIIQLPLHKLRRHPLNILRSEPDPELSRVLTADIKKQGVEDPILVTPDYLVIQGWRLVLASRKAGLEHIDGPFTELNFSSNQLVKLVYRDNTLREGYKDPDYETIASTIFTPAQIYDGAERKIERKAKKLTGVPAGSWKRVFARMRQKNQKQSNWQFSLKPEEKRFAKHRIAELNRILDRKERLSSELNTLDKKQKESEREITSLIPKTAGIKDRQHRIAAIKRRI